jgi:hypothetical protein
MLSDLARMCGWANDRVYARQRVVISQGYSANSTQFWSVKRNTAALLDLKVDIFAEAKTITNT